MAVKLAQSGYNPANELRWASFLEGCDAESKRASRKHTEATK
jgi:hypothetical protein